MGSLGICAPVLAERESLERELARRVADALSELVECVQRSAAGDGTRLEACVIDDFELLRTELRPDDCRLSLAFEGSARITGAEAPDCERIFGLAGATINGDGRVHFRDVVMTLELAFVPHDVGGAD